MKDFWKKYYIYFISILLGIIAAINVSVAGYALNTVDYNITLGKDNIISHIYINDNDQNLELYKTELLENTEEGLTASESASFTITTSVIDKLMIYYDNDDITISRNRNIEQLNSDNYVYDISMFNIIKSSITPYTLLFVLIFSIIFVFIIKIIKNTISKINESKVKIKDVVLFFIANFVLFLSTIYILLVLFKTFIILIIVGYLVYLLYKIKDNLKLENVYIILGIIIGISFIFLIPPYHVPDEETHYMKSYKLLEIEARDDNGIGVIDSKLNDFMSYYEYTAMDYDVKFNGRNYLNQIFDNEKSNTTSEKIYQNTKRASFIPYLPSAITVSICKTLDFSYLLTFLLGRMTNLLISIIICYISLKQLLSFKKVFLIIMLLPAFVQASMGYNMDYLTNSVSIFIISYFIKLIYQKEKINYKQILVLILSGLLLTFCKFGFFPIMFISILLPLKKFNTKIKPIYIILFLCLFVFIISYARNRGTIVGDSASPYYTINYVVSNPVNTAHIFIKTALKRLDVDIYRGLFDGFGVYTKFTPSLIETFLIIMYAFILLVNDEDKKLKIKERITYLVISMMMIAIPYVSMFLCWTKMGLDTIEGIQPRYFLIATLLLFIGLSNNIFELKIKNKNVLYVLCIVISFVTSLFTILLGFY